MQLTFSDSEKVYGKRTHYPSSRPRVRSLHRSPRDGPSSQYLHRNILLLGLEKSPSLLNPPQRLPCTIGDARLRSCNRVNPQRTLPMDNGSLPPNKVDSFGHIIRPSTHKLYRIEGSNFAVGLVFNEFDVCVMCAPLLSQKVIGLTIAQVEERCKKNNYKFARIGVMDSKP